MKNLFIFAGEASGDLLGGKLIEALGGEYTLTGVAGPQMRKQGIDPLLPMEAFEVMGFTDVVLAFPRLYRHFKTIKRYILKHQPDGVVSIDYPEFNMLMAQALRKNGYRGKLIHYVSPSVWAWRAKRVYTLAASFDHLLSIFPFEKRYYAKTDLPVTYVGHPLVTTIAPIAKEKDLIAIFPGSRRHEIHHNLGAQIAAVKKLKGNFRVAISVAHPSLKKEIASYNTLGAELTEDKSLMGRARVAIATSGTVNLELALHQTPTVVTYGLSSFNYYLARYLLRIPLRYYSLPNIIAEKVVFPEFYNRRLNICALTMALQHLIDAPQESIEGCRQVGALLSSDDPAIKAAQTIKEVMG